MDGILNRVLLYRPAIVPLNTRINDVPVVTPYYAISEDGHQAYLEIPKSGCSSIKDHIGHKGDLSPFPIDGNTFTVLREPIGRVLSGFRQLKRMGKINKDATIDDCIETIYDRGFFDRHIVPQCVFIEQHFQNFDNLIIYDWGYMRGVEVRHNESMPWEKEKPTPQNIIALRELYKEDIKLWKQIL